MTDNQLAKFLGGRKFVLSLLSLLSASILCWLGKIDDGVYSAVVIATVGAYIAGNVFQHVNTKEN